MIFDKKFEVFLTVAELGSFSKAARRLSMTQSSVSFHIQSLEKALSVKLFDRKGRTIALTPEGECLRNEGESLMKRARHLEHTLSDLSSNVASNIRLAGDAMMCAFTFPFVLRDFKQRYPAVELSYQHLEREEIVEKLLASELDLALIGYPFRHRKLESQMCFSSPVALVASGATAALPGRVEDLRDVPILWSTADKGLELLLTRRLTEAGLPPRDLNIVMDVEDLNLIKTAAQAEIGMVFLPELTVGNELESGVLQKVLLKDFDLRQTTYMFARKENHREIVRQFWSYIEERRTQAERDLPPVAEPSTA